MPKVQKQTVKLTGRVVEADHEEVEELSIRLEQAAEYEARGYAVTTIAGLTLAFKDSMIEDGTIAIAPRLDSAGRAAVKYRNTNFGFSGYFIGYVYEGGKRRTIVDWKALFPKEENRYSTQGEKGTAEAAVAAIVESRSGAVLTKVKRGYAFEQVRIET